MRSFFLLIVTFLILVGCKPTKESLDQHAEITASLREYENDVFFQENYSDTVLTDYMHMSYEAYREKYDLRHRDMDYVAQLSKANISILKSYRSLKKMEALRDSLKNIPRIDTAGFGSYSFNKIVPIAISVDSNSVVDSTGAIYLEMQKFDADSLEQHK
ncbi:MAG: hypothetical protein ACFHU9_15020 [Fluviicola sp.]